MSVLFFSCSPSLSRWFLGGGRPDFEVISVQFYVIDELGVRFFHSKTSVSRDGVVCKTFPELGEPQLFDIADDDHGESRSTETDVHSPAIVEETDRLLLRLFAVLRARTYGREDDNIFLSALESVDCVDFHRTLLCLVELLDLSLDLLHLTRVCCDDTELGNVEVRECRTEFRVDLHDRTRLIAVLV